MTDKNMTGLSQLLAKVGAETGQYNTETGTAADAFAHDHNALRKSFQNPLCLSYAFDTPKESKAFVDGIGADPHTTNFRGIEIPILHCKRVEEFYGRPFNAVLLALPACAGTEFVSTRLTKLAESNGGRLVYTVGAPALEDPDGAFDPRGNTSGPKLDF